MPHLPFDSSRRLGRGVEMGALVERMTDWLPLHFARTASLEPHPNSGRSPVLSSLNVQEIKTRMHRNGWGPIVAVSRERTI